MYDYNGLDGLITYMAGTGIVNIIIGYLLILVILAVISYAFAIVPYVANTVVFMKAGEAPWKSLIPIYDTYTYFKICKIPKLFIAYIVIGVGQGLSGIFSFTTIMDSYSIFYGELSTAAIIWTILSSVFSIASLVLYIILNINIAKAFNKGGGFIVGLVLLNPIFLMILAFGSAEYQYVDGTRPDPEPFAPKPRPGYVEFITGDKAGARKELLDGESIIIGRDPMAADLVVDRGREGSKVSRRHCEVQYAAEHNVFYITDFSSNGTMLEDGTKLLVNVKTPVKRGTAVILPKDIRFIVK